MVSNLRGLCVLFCCSYVDSLSSISGLNLILSKNEYCRRPSVPLKLSGQLLSRWTVSETAGAPLAPLADYIALNSILRGGLNEEATKSDSIDVDQQGFNFKKIVTAQFEELFSDNWKQELGYVCLGFGAFFLASALNPIPFLGLWMNRKAILLANLMLISGSAFLVGLAELKRFFLTRSRCVGSLLIIFGFCAIWRDRSERWTMLYFTVQLLGVLSLFGPYAQSFFRFAASFVWPMVVSILNKLFRWK